MKKQHGIIAVIILICVTGFAICSSVNKSNDGDMNQGYVEEMVPLKTHHIFLNDVWAFVEQDIPYVDERTFEIIKSAYSEVDFTAEFEQGNRESYEDYLKKFWHLLQNDIPFWDRELNRNVFIKDWEEVYGQYATFDLRKSLYYFFDMNGDGFPELCIDPQEPVVIFEYDAEKDQCILWAWLGGKDIIGTGKVMLHPEYESIICDFFQLNEYGDFELETLFWAEFFFGMGEDINMVMFPNYLAQEKKWILTEDIKQQGILEESSGQWFFRITDEQFEELQKPYMEAYNLALERQRKEAYTYEELFGKFESK